jgi:hypothetical protein
MHSHTSLGSFEKDMSTAYIGVCESVRVPKTKVHMRLGGKVKNRIDAISGKAIEDLRRVSDVATDKGKAFDVMQMSDVV